MAMYRWTEQDTLNLIELYKTFPFLWDSHHKLYKNTIARNCAYEMMLDKLEQPELTIMDIKIKIKNLRSSYYYELRKMRKAKEEGNKYTPSRTIRVWFTKFQNIMDQVHKTYDEEDNLGYGNNEIECIEESEANSDSGAYVVTIKQEYLDELENQNRKEIASIGEYQHDPKVLKQKKCIESPVSPVVHETKDYKLDEFQIFANNMAEQLRMLPLDKALELQIKVQSVIAKERINLYREKEDNIE